MISQRDNFRLLITVEDCFSITGRGTVLLPAFTVPSEGRTNIKVEALIIRPDLTEERVKMSLNAECFVLFDVSGMKWEWRVIGMLFSIGKEAVSPGSKIMINDETALKLTETLNF